MKLSYRLQSRIYLQKSEMLRNSPCIHVMGISHQLDVMKFILKRSFLKIQCEMDSKNRHILCLGFKVRKFIEVAKKY